MYSSSAAIVYYLWFLPGTTPFRCYRYIVLYLHQHDKSVLLLPSLAATEQIHLFLKLGGIYFHRRFGFLDKTLRLENEPSQKIRSRARVIRVYWVHDGPLSSIVLSVIECNAEAFSSLYEKNKGTFSNKSVSVISEIEKI